ncbi:Ribonuclease P protein component [Indibacter alkaliphilus LW1]|uniref:Ribonuclease P protein component n=2 Tax=Indibacter TaxID=647744 RepID=S2CZ63_INDAL|nr:Ribonuclease P protein component [Indibacter alkaliphilus LW1]
MNFKLGKSERLHSEKSIKELFDKGSSFFLYPFKVVLLDLPSNQDGTVQVLFSVPKKKIKKAVLRNFVKRRVKEAYRLNKHLLSVGPQRRKLIGFIYVSSEVVSFQYIQGRMVKVITKIKEISDSQIPKE